MTRATVTKGSGNVFRDLGFSEEKSAEPILKRNTCISSRHISAPAQRIVLDTHLIFSIRPFTRRSFAGPASIGKKPRSPSA